SSSTNLGKRKARVPPPQDASIIEISSDDDTAVPDARDKFGDSNPKSDSFPPAKRIKLEDVPAPSSSSKGDNTTEIANGREELSTKDTVAVGTSKKRSKRVFLHEKIDRKSGKKVTRSLWVQHIKDLDDIPAQWDVTRELTAYVVDLTDNDKFDLDKKSIIQWIRHEVRSSCLLHVSVGLRFFFGKCQCSLTGNSGHSRGEVYVEAGILSEEKVWCRRGEYTCNGIKACEYIDKTLLDGFEGWEFDRDELRPFWTAELDAHEVEASNMDAGLLRCVDLDSKELKLLMDAYIRFYLTAKNTKCKIKCDGKAVVRKIPAERPNFGNRSHFIGCSKFKKSDERGSHRSLQIPINLDEAAVVSLFENNGKIKHKDEVELHSSCSVVVHPRSHKTECPFTHVVDKQASTGRIDFYKDPCPSRLLIFEPVDNDECGRKALVVPENPHNHPRHLHAKPTLADKELLQKVAAASGKPHITPKELRTSSTTNEILKGRTWEEAFPCMTDNQRLRRWIRALDKTRYPEGLGWKGVQHEFENVESFKPMHERYIHSVISKSDGVRLIVTMHPELVKHIHSVSYLVIDYTFKRIKGDLNEWAVVSMLERYQTRIQFASLYCNKADRSTFKLLVSEFFETIERVTGKKLEFFLFNRDAKLLCLIFDAEAAQMQGCGDVLLSMNISEVSGVTTRDPLLMIQHLAKTCVEHFNR
ncbi:hypothetical protein CVT26_003262, partial [Gymnopilus dilepis]